MGDDREAKNNLRSLTRAVEQVIKLLDAEFQKPSDFARGQRIAKIMNALEMANDSAKRFGLGKR